MTTSPGAVNVIYRNLPLAGVRLFAGLFSPIRRWKTGRGGVAMTGWQEQVAENARRYGELNERLARTTATETSRDGVVRVTVAADGSVAELVLAEPRQPLPMAELATQIMGCLHRARARIPDLLAKAMAETVGHGEGTDLVLADARTRFPPAPPEPVVRGPEVVEEMRIGAAPREERPPVAPRVRRRDDRDGRDDGWNERPILEDV